MALDYVSRLREFPFFILFLVLGITSDFYFPNYLLKDFVSLNYHFSCVHFHFRPSALCFNRSFCANFCVFALHSVTNGTFFHLQSNLTFLSHSFSFQQPKRHSLTILFPSHRPMKKKSGPSAGIPRASGERDSPTGGSYLNQQVSYFDVYIISEPTTTMMKRISGRCCKVFHRFSALLSTLPSTLR